MFGRLPNAAVAMSSVALAQILFNTGAGLKYTDMTARQIDGSRILCSFRNDPECAFMITMCRRYLT
jgi:hypothetical protein